MVFKTITTDLNGVINKIGIFNRSFADLKNAISVNGIGGLFNSISPTITSKDLSNIKEYNRLVSVEGVSSQTAWYRTMLSSSQAAQSLFDDEKNLIRTNNGLVLSEETVTQATNTMTLGAKAAKVGMQALATAGNMLLMYGVSQLISGLYELSQVSKNVAQSAQDISSSFASTQSEINDYKSRVEDLYKTINNSSSSIEEVTQARKDLLMVQDELINKFGTEKDTIDIVSDAINNHSNAWDKLTAKQWQEKLNEFNDEGFLNGVGNFFGGYSDNIDRMLNEYGDYSAKIDLSKYFDFSGISTDEYNDFKKELENTFGASFFQDDNGNYYAELSGNATDVYEKLLDIQNLTDEFHFNDDFSKSLTKLANSAKDVSSKYENMYNQYILQEEVFANSDYVDSFKTINDAYKEYENAFASGDNEAIDKAIANYSNVVSTSMSEALANGDGRVAEYFESMYPELQAVISKWKFKTTILPEFKTEGLQGLTQGDVLKMIETDGTSDAEDTFNSIVGKAKEYGLITDISAEGIQKVLDLLVEWGILQGEIADSASETDILSISSTIDNLNTKLKPAMDSLASAWQNIFPDNGFTLNNVDFSMFGSIKSKLDEMQKAGLNVDYSSFENLFTILNDTDSERVDVENGFNELAMSIAQAALTGAEDFDTLKSVLEDLGVVNNELVAFEALSSNTEALKEAGLDLADASDEQIAAFANEFVSAENLAQAIDILRFQKELYNLQGMDTSGEVANLLTLAQNAGYTGEVVQYLTELEQIYQEVASGTLSPGLLDSKLARASELKGLIEQSTSKINYEPKVDFSGLKNSASKAGTESGKSYKDALKDELSDLNDVIGGITDIIDDQIDKFNDQKDAAVDALEAQKEAAEKALQAEKDAIQEQIDAKQDEIDKIKEAQEERKNDMELQKAQYDLARMQNQKTRFLFNGEQMTYDTDITGIRDAREQVTQAQENIRVASIEKEISGLEDVLDSLDKKIEASNTYYDSLIEQTEQYWNSLIKGLEDYKSRWTELAGMEDQAKVLAQLEQMGISTSDILSMSEATFQNFKTNYMGILTEMYSGSDQMLSSLSEVANVDMSPLSSNLEGAKTAIDEFGNADVSKVSNVFDAVTSAVNNTADAIVGSGGSSKGESGSSGNADTGSASAGGSNGTSLKSAIEEQTESAIQNLTKEKELFNGEDGLTSAVQDVITKIGSEDSKNKEKETEDSGEGTDLISAIQGQYDKTMKLVPEQSEKFLTLADSINQCVTALKEMISLMQEVSTVPTLPSGEVSTVHTSSSGISHGGGGKAFTTSTNSATLRGIKLFEEVTSQGSTHRNIETHAQAFHRNVSTISTRNIQPSFTMTGDVNVTCPGVTSQAVMKEVGAALKNEFSGLALEAYQKSHITR